MESVSKIIGMIFYGLSTFSLYSKRNYHRNISEITVITSGERWKNIGTRLKNATCKVVGQTG